ncbi:hypothetical protein N7522_005313 [Penicillium canescens]|nr:hypothetical protein N7522_006211 [Penicillium canescens]KAJ6006962.1 hypothetical protein N7522_005313 [Penicillium canescens]
MNGSVVSDATVEGPKHLSIALEKVLPDLINHELPKSPTFQTNIRQPLTWLLERASVELSMAVKPAQSYSEINDQASLPGPDGFDLKHPICTTLKHFKSFRKWV